MLVAAVPLPDFVDESWVRLAMLAGALILPLLIGLAAVFVTGQTKSRGPVSLITAILRGYPFAFVLTLVLVLLAFVGTFRKLRSLSKRWEDAHIPVIVKPGAYDAVLAEVESTLDDAGLDVAPRDAGLLLSGPPKLLDLIAGRALGELVPDRLQILASPQLEVLVYPSDLAISGTKTFVARARAALASHVAEAPAYLTTTAEAQRIEDRIAAIRVRAKEWPVPETLAALRELDHVIARLAVPYDEWQIVYRLRVQIERDVLRSEDAYVPIGQEAPLPAGEPKPRPSRLQWAIGMGGIGLIVLDLIMLLAGRRQTEAKPDK
jgi:hypothetical protein